MIKKLLLLAILSLTSLGLLIHQTSAGTELDAQTIPEENTIVNNYTLEKMKEVWKDKTRAEFDNYFGDLSDETRILASEEGGISYFKDNVGMPEDGNLGPITLEDGTTFQPNIKGPDSSTVGELRQMMYKILK